MNTRWWLLLAAVASPACAASTSAGSALTSTNTAESADSIEADHVRELEARVAMLEQELAVARATSTSRAISLRSDGGASREDEGALVLPGSYGATIAPTAESETNPPEDIAGGERVTIRLHESRPMMLPPAATTERLPVVAMPALPPGPPLATTSTVAPLPPAAALQSPTLPPNVVQAPPLVVAAQPMPGTTAAQVDTLAEYRAGLAHLTARRFEPAIGSLSAFLRDNPGSAQADDALYWRATAYYALRRYREASIDYDRVVRIAPRGDRAADALYHSALCARRLGDDARARASFARVQREYPDSVAARLAAREDTT